MDAKSSERASVKLDLIACACIVHAKKVLLLAHRKSSFWLLPGGHVEAGETPDGALSREVLEETGLNIIFLQPSPQTFIKHLRIQAVRV